MQPHSEKWPHAPVSLCLPLTGSQEAFQPNTSAHEELTLWRTLGSSITQTLFILTGAHSYHVACVPTALQMSSVQTEEWLFCTLQGWTPLQIGDVMLKGGQVTRTLEVAWTWLALGSSCSRVVETGGVHGSFGGTGWNRRLRVVVYVAQRAHYFYLDDMFIWLLGRGW